MRRTLAVMLAGFILSPSCFAQTKSPPSNNPTPRSKVEKAETPHLAFVTEYIRELSAVEDIRESGEKDLKQDPDGTFSNMIHTSTMFQLELGSQLRILKGMRLDEPYAFLIPTITGFYEHKIELWKRMGDIGGALVVPKPGVDYSKLAAEMPQIRAQLDYIDQSLFQVMPAVFATLIDMKPDSQNHANHLIITKAERAQLIDNLDIDFGSKLDQKDQNYTVSAASVLKAYLLKDFKSSDEPWD